MNDTSLMTLTALSDLETALTAPEVETAQQLVHAARWVIENKTPLAQAKDIHDALNRLKIQLEQRGVSLYTANLLTAERIRLEWAMGATLTETPRAAGGRGNVSLDGNSFLGALERAGLDKSTAYRWQNLAKIDPQDLEIYFEESIRNGAELSTAATLNYFTSHVTIDPRPDADDEPAAAIPAPESHDEFEFPKIRVVTIVCRHCGTKDTYDVTE